LLGYWYDKEGKVTNEMIDSLDGIFAFTLFDERTGHLVAARDPMGICPMYWGKGADGSTWFASEMKALHDVCETFEIFPPVCTLSQETSLISVVHSKRDDNRFYKGRRKETRETKREKRTRK
jgi:asparagine synthetase B (glutamine-hydrolysing)